MRTGNSVDSEVSQYHPDEVVRWTDFYNPWPKQAYFHDVLCKHRLQIGSFGSGKSKPLLMEAVLYCTEYPGVNAIILRKTMPDLKRTVIDKFETDVPKSVYERGSQEKGTFNKSDHIVYFPPQLVPLYDPVAPSAVHDDAFYAGIAAAYRDCPDIDRAYIGYPGGHPHPRPGGR